MTNKVCFALYCMCTFCLTGRSSALYSVVSADGKLQTSWNWFSSPTLLSLCEFILLVSTTGLSPHNSFLSKHFIFRKNVCSLFFFFSFFRIRRPCRLTTSESNGAAEKMTSSMTGPETSAQHFRSFFSVNLWGRVNVFRCCFHCCNTD